MTSTPRSPTTSSWPSDRRLQRALESWQPRFIEWWKELGPVAFQDNDVYLRTAISVGQEGWANFGHVKMPDYRWGIFLADPEPDRTVAFGDHLGDPVWQEVPGEYRADLRRLIVVQGDTEPASVEQQRSLCLTAPSLYDMRNLFQVNVEEGRHLWAMVYLLHRYFGRDGRDEADEMLERHSGDHDHPRILGAFNEPTPDWLSFFLFTYFTDRDGKFQLASLRESGFDPLSRTCDFMLKEEAHHMFVGASGVARVVQRTVELMKEHDTADVNQFGGVDVATLQRYLNFHYSVSLDLFGAETSTNAANYFAAGLKGRFQEERRDDDHRLKDATRDRAPRRRRPRSARVRRRSWRRSTRRCATTTSPTARRASTAGTARSPRSVCKLTLPHVGFNRAVGEFSAHHVSPDGRLLSDEEWAAAVGRVAADRRRPRPRRLAHAGRHRAGEDGRLGRSPVDRHPPEARRLRLRARSEVCETSAGGEEETSHDHGRS